jgi:hypothetical protein
VNEARNGANPRLRTANRTRLRSGSMTHRPAVRMDPSGIGRQHGGAS